MSIYLLVAPRNHYVNATASDALRAQEVAATITQTALDHYIHSADRLPETTRSVTSFNSRWPIAVGMLARPWENTRTEYRPGRFVVTSGNASPADLIDSIIWTSGVPSYRRPVWGSYTCVAHDSASRRVRAWNTLPALEGVHYSQTEDFSILSNRPLLAAIARAKAAGRTVEFNNDYLLEYLAVGYSISGQTGYADVHIAPSDQSLEISPTGIRVAEKVQGLSGEDISSLTMQDRAFVLAEALKRSAARSAESVSSGSIQVRMSGGKDSRLILGLYRDLDVKLEALTFGSENTPESVVAQRLCELAGVPLTVVPPELGMATTTRGRVLRSISLGDGHPLSEPHASVYNNTPYIRQGDGLSLGQWPLFKGGAARKLRYSSKETSARLREQYSPLLAASFRAPLEQGLLDWSRELDNQHPTEVLYHFSRSFRSGRWQQTLVAHHERSTMLAYPISDSEVTSVSDQLPAVDKISNVALFYALQAIWPDAVRVPLASGRWPFEAPGRSEEHSGLYFDERNADPLSVARKFRPAAQRRVNFEFSQAALEEISRELVGSEFASFFSGIVEERFWKAICDFSLGQSAVHPEVPQGVLKRLVWRVYAAEVWLSRDWL